MSEVGYGTGGRVGVFNSRSRSMIPNLIPYSLLIKLPNPAYPPPEFSQLIKFRDMSQRIWPCAPGRLHKSL